jgi:alpha-beta hydrolase superfamily lysophospholipase
LVDIDNMWNAFMDSFTFLPKDDSLANLSTDTTAETMAEEAEAVMDVDTMTEVTDVTIVANDGLELDATFYPGQGEGERPAVLLLHMLNGNRVVWADFAAQLNEAGYSALALDMRGHGTTSGSIDWATARDDMTVVWSYLSNLPNVDANNTAVIGGSIGANMALLTGADVPLVKTAALLSPGLDYRGVKTAEAIVAYGDRPLLIVASNEDVYAAESSTTLAENAATPELMLYDGAGHGTNIFRADVGLADSLVAWLDNNLQ